MNVILYSEQNFVWTSMQEIIPGLVECWESTATNGQETILINVDTDKVLNYTKELLSCENIILTCFNLNISKAAKLIRSGLGVDARFIIHLHGLASVACWPLLEFKLTELLLEKDIFISTCENDKKAFELSYENAQCEIVPFHFPEVVNKKNVRNEGQKIKLVYVGRLAEQKNLHQLLWCLSLVNQYFPEIEYECLIFGSKDDLGSPNMNISFDNYDNYLKDLKEELDLKNVEFKGFVPRLELDEWLSLNKHIFISLSLHSDENFGMAALKSLSFGNDAILSGWGGHSDFKMHFKEMVSLINVYKSDYGPVLDPRETVLTIAEVLKKNVSNEIKTDYYDFKKIVETFQRILTSKHHLANKCLKVTPFAHLIHKQRNILLGKKGCQVFTGYSDSNADPFFIAYGMKEIEINREARSHVAPWAKIGRFVDPHKGNLEISSEEDLLKNGFVY